MYNLKKEKKSDKLLISAWQIAEKNNVCHKEIKDILKRKKQAIIFNEFFYIILLSLFKL